MRESGEHNMDFQSFSLVDFHFGLTTLFSNYRIDLLSVKHSQLRFLELYPHLALPKILIMESVLKSDNTFALFKKRIFLVVHLYFL